MFGDIKNINIQENTNTSRIETKKTEVINHHINLDSLKTQSTKNTETRFEFENVNYGQLKKNNVKVNGDVNMNMNIKVNSEMNLNVCKKSK